MSHLPDVTPRDLLDPDHPTQVVQAARDGRQGFHCFHDHGSEEILVRRDELRVERRRGRPDQHLLPLGGAQVEVDGERANPRHGEGRGGPDVADDDLWVDALLDEGFHLAQDLHGEEDHGRGAVPDLGVLWHAARGGETVRAVRPMPASASERRPFAGPRAATPHLAHADVHQRFGGRMLHLQQLHDRRAVVADRRPPAVGDELVHPARAERRAHRVGDGLARVDIADELGLALRAEHTGKLVSRVRLERCLFRGYSVDAPATCPSPREAV